MKNSLKQPKWHTQYFHSLEQVEAVFDRPLSGQQQEMIAAYLKTGVRPQANGCWTCDEGVMRVLTGKIDEYEIAVTEGREVWPY